MTFTAPCPGCDRDATWEVHEPSGRLEAGVGYVTNPRTPLIICPSCDPPPQVPS